MMYSFSVAELPNSNSYSTLSLPLSGFCRVMFCNRIDVLKIVSFEVSDYVLSVSLVIEQSLPDLNLLILLKPFTVGWLLNLLVMQPIGILSVDL